MSGAECSGGPDEVFRQFVHDLRSPVAAIEAAAGAVRADSRCPAELHALLDLVSHEARVVQSMADAALEGDRRTAPVPVVRVLEEVADRARTRWCADVRVVAPDAQACVTADVEQVRRAVGNLVDNALVHGRTQGVTLGAVRSSDWVVIRVHGVGRAERRRSHVSHGLGLASVRHVAAAAGGRYAHTVDEDGRVDELWLRAADDVPA